MEVEEDFVAITGLLCEPARAKMLWNLLDGRAYTAGELAICADVSATSASNHLAKLLQANLLKVEMQGRHRYYSFSKPEVAYAVESLASLTNNKKPVDRNQKKIAAGVKYCRTCYDHVAGYVGVKIVEEMERQGVLQKHASVYKVTNEGWTWLALLDIRKNEINKRRPLTRQCLDWSERRPHLAGQLGALLLEKMLERKWFKKVQFSRELVFTLQGKQEMRDFLGINLF